jgi:hypothetical protein
MKKSSVLILLLILTITGFSDELSYRWEFTKYAFKNIKINKKFLKSSLVIGTATVGLSFMDNFIKDEANDRLHSKFSSVFFKTINDLGEGKYILPFYLTVYGTGIVLKNKKLKNFSYNAFLTYCFSGFITSSIKYSGRLRPSKTDNNYIFKPFSGNESFPSGHTMVIFSLLASLGYEFNIEKYTIPLAYTFSFARVYLNKHWASDVFFSAVITTLIAKYIHNMSVEYDGVKLTLLRF